MNKAFRYEKEMIPVLKTHLSGIFKTTLFVEEFSSGLGIADLVFTTKALSKREPLQDFESMYYILNFFMGRNKTVSPLDLIERHNLKKEKFLFLIQYLKALKCISDYTHDQLLIKKDFKPSVPEIFAIEAKLDDWKQGLHQALRYKQFAHKSYLAISSSSIHRVDISLLKHNNIGLIAVDPTGIQIRYNPKKAEPINRTAQFYLSETFAALSSRI